VAMGDHATQAARALARALYSEPALRPAIDNEIAEVLAGRAPSEGASAQLRELAAVRSSLPSDPEDPTARRLLLALGQEQRAEVVVVVSAAGQRFVARVLRVGPGTYDPVQILARPVVLPPPPKSQPEAADAPAQSEPEAADPPAQSEPEAADPPAQKPPSSPAVPVPAPVVEWPGAADALRALMPKRPAAAPPPPALAPAKTRSDVDLRPASDEEPKVEWYENPWFWGSAGAVAAVGVTVLVLAVSTEDDVGTVNVGGKVAR